MDKKEFDLIKRTSFFKNSLDRIKSIDEISSNKYKISYDDSFCVLGIYSINNYDKLQKEVSINDDLKSIGLNTLETYEVGIMPDLNISYKLFEYREEISLGEFLEKSNKDEKYDIGLKFGKILKEIHTKKINNEKNENWYEKIITKVNLLLYRQGLNRENDVKDYILIDYLNSNSYICKNTSSNLLYQNLSDKNIRIYNNDNIDIRGIKELTVGDGISDFVNINKIAIYHPEFAKGVLQSYHKGEVISRKFYRLLSFYQAYYILKSLVDIREKKQSYLSEDEINKMINMYDDFSTIIPSWV